MQRPIQYIVPTALVVYLSPLRKPKDQISSSVRVARRPLVGIAEIGLIQGQTVRPTLRHNRQGLWQQHKAGKPVRRVLIWFPRVRVVFTCDAAVGLSSAMAVDNSIRSVKVIVRDTSLTRLGGRFRERAVDTRLRQLAYEHQIRGLTSTQMILRNANKFSWMSRA